MTFPLSTSSLYALTEKKAQGVHSHASRSSLINVTQGLRIGQILWNDIGIGYGLLGVSVSQVHWKYW